MYENKSEKGTLCLHAYMNNVNVIETFGAISEVNVFASEICFINAVSLTPLFGPHVIEDNNIITSRQPDGAENARKSMKVKPYFILFWIN